MNTAQKPKSLLPVEVSLLRGGNVKSSWSIGPAKPETPKFATLAAPQPLQVSTTQSVPIAPSAPTVSLSSIPQCSLCKSGKNISANSSAPTTVAKSNISNSNASTGNSSFMAKIQKPPTFSLGRSLDPWHITRSTAPAHELFPPRPLKPATAPISASSISVTPVIPAVSNTLAAKKVAEEKISAPTGTSAVFSGNDNSNMGMKVGMLSTATWGRLYWGMMHAQAYYYSTSPTDQERALKLKWFETTIPTIPCPTCRHSAEEWCSLNPLSAAVQNQWTLTKWVRDFENDVRARTTRKSPSTAEQISAKYEFPTVPRRL